MYQTKQTVIQNSRISEKFTYSLCLRGRFNKMPRHCLTSHTASVDVKHHERRRRKMRSNFRVYTFEPLRVHTASYGRWPGELVWPSGKALAGKQRDVGSNPFRLSFLFKGVVVCGHCLLTSSLTINETLKWLSPLPILMQESSWW